MGNPAEEKQVFIAFLQQAPLFAGARVMNWIQPTSDPPDIACELADGRRIGVELTSWLEESQIGQAKIIESLENSIRDAIKPEPPNETEHIWFLWMFPKRKMQKPDCGTFRSQLLKLAEEIDQRWDSETEWHTPQRFQWNDFTAYPMLGKYLDAVDVHPRIPSRPTTMSKGGQHWLTFPMSGGAYSPDWMVDALHQCVQTKTLKYSAKPTGMNEFHLLVHYDKALLYNTPVQGIDFGYANAIQAVAERIGSSAGIFDKVFVFVPIAEGQQVFGLYPA